ncbi:ribosomal maturation YjgA family protein [Sphingobacterium cavernae]|uniref:ribosomal maturation YjgA family protein n=1 Tax=Sphingobacterium cavernae TaxID=2592657 RepID=UPI00122FE2E5
MLKRRLIYFILIIITIALGLFSRKIEFLPLATGDALYAIMVYWGFRFLFTKRPLHYALLLSIAFCFSIEFLQLVRIPFLIEARNHSLLRLVLGQGFLWSDLIAYGSGAFACYLLDKKFLFSKK